MCQDYIKIFACFFNNCSQTDDFRSGAHDNQKLKLAVVLEAYLAIITHALPLLTRQRYQDAADQTVRWPTLLLPGFLSVTG